MKRLIFGIFIISVSCFLIITSGCNSQANLSASGKEYSDEDWLRMIKKPENQVKTFWSGKDRGSIDNKGKWGMSLSGLSFLHTPSYILENQISELTRNRPLLFLPLFYEWDPDIVLTGIYFYSRCNINKLDSREQEQIKAAFKKALKHGDTRVRCAAIETLTMKNLLDVEDIGTGLNDEATIVRAMTASFINIFFENPYYNAEMGLDNFLNHRKQIKRDIAPILIGRLNDTSFYVRQTCAMAFWGQICPNINGESSGNHIDWVTSDWKSILETQKQWKTWWAENGENVLLENSSQVGLKQNTQSPDHLNGTIDTPIEVVKSLLEAIENKDWEKACEYLSSTFLLDHKKEVLEGKYFARTGSKDQSAFYSSDTKVNPKWNEQDNGKKAIVTLTVGGSSPNSLVGICQLILEKEDGQWKGSGFNENIWGT